MILLELFSGIGGFAKGFLEAGFKFDKHYFSEIDKHAIANYKYNFKNAESIGSVTDVRGDEIERPDIITFGFPCQDLSIAGKRKGFHGERSSLFYQAMRIINEVKPDIFIFENVKGLFSSNGGKDFTAVLRTIADIGLYECEWQLVNTKWVLPQNRERVYFIGHLRGTSQPRVFPFRENDFPADELQRQYTNVIKNGYGRHDDGSYIIEREQLQENKINVIGNLKENGHEVHNVHGSNGISPTVRDNHGCVSLVVHNTMPRSGNPKQGGTGHLKRNDGVSYNIDTGNTNAIEIGDRIRKYTEIECERLQGFPDNWTKYGDYDGVIKKIPRTQRYKMLGNAVTVNIVKLIAERLK